MLTLDAIDNMAYNQDMTDAKASRKRGGRRPGAGRPPLRDDPMVRISVMLPPSYIAQASCLGQGNVSKGLRIILDQYLEDLRRTRHDSPA